MPATNWTVTIGGTSFTSITQSLSFTVGRSSWFDTPTGNNCTLTVRNNTGQAASLSQGDQIVIGNDLGSVSMYFYVVEVTFQDEISANADTATITGTDALGMMSLFYVNDDPVIGYTNAIYQAGLIAQEVYPFVPPYPTATATNGRATVSDAFDPTTIGQRVVELLQTENSTYYYDGATLEFRTSAAPADSLTTFGTDSATTIIYDGLTRKYPNANYPNVVNLTSTTAGTTYATSPSNYERNYNRQVLFNTVSQQQAQTDYLAAILSDDSQLYVDVRFNDVAQSTTPLTSFLNAIGAMSGQTTQLTYTPPGGEAITSTFVIEGASMSAIPGRTDWIVYLSPRLLYDLFTLDSSTFGILGGTMVYNTPITYNDAGETYNATATDNGNRLGW